MARRLAALLCAVMIVMSVGPAAALAQTTGTPLTPGLPAISTPTATTPTATVPLTNTTASSGGGFSGTDAIAVAAGAVALLTGISFFIWRDARRRAPGRGRTLTATAGTGTRTGSKPRPKSRKPSPAERRRRKRGRAR